MHASVSGTRSPALEVWPDDSRMARLRRDRARKDNKPSNVSASSSGMQIDN
jgi:hypothetical protein